MQYRIKVFLRDAMGTPRHDIWVEAEGESLWEALGHAASAMGKLGFTDMSPTGETKRFLKPTNLENVNRFVSEWARESTRRKTAASPGEFAKFFSDVQKRVDFTNEHLAGFLDVFVENIELFKEGDEAAFNARSFEARRGMIDRIWGIASTLVEKRHAWV